jgi:hypothetical protein
MKNQLFNLINEQTSPLSRIMSITNSEISMRRKFDNNITAFHIGNGFVLSVAHNLNPEAQLIKSIDEADFQTSIIANCNPNETILFNKCFLLDPVTNRRHINIADQNDIKPLIAAFKRINYDTRWVTQYQNGICKPFLIVQFENNLFYNDAGLTALFNPNHSFPEPGLGVHTFLIELELVKAFYSEDIALYKMTNIDQAIIDKIPYAEISWDMHITNQSLFCLQASPSGTNLGRMVNESRIEGLLDHHSVQKNRIGGDFIRNGLRYLLKGYFRFGSSGAPYFVFDEESDSFMVNGIQSEASPIQLSINNNRNGNFQYTNAIASPLKIIETELKQLTNTLANTVYN